MKFATGIILIISVFLTRCDKPDNISPQITLLDDASLFHYLGMPYIDPGVSVIDDHTCNLSDKVVTENNVDENLYGSYTINYSVEDDAGNSSTATRSVDIILQPSDYYSLNYTATDSCQSGVYIYNGYVQDCDCSGNEITVANISNFGLSALFTLQLSGTYSEQIVLDTSKAAVQFLGSGIMSRNADTIFWNYTISDSISSDVCTSTWIKN